MRDNLVTSNDFLAARTGGREDFHSFLAGPPAPPSADGIVRDALGLFPFVADMPPNEILLLARKLTMYLTSCDDRRFGQWEQISMWDYFDAEGRSETYRAFAMVLSRFIQSTPPKIASARAHMNLFEAVIYCLLGHGQEGRPFAQLLNAPTNEAWIDPWILHLRSLGVRFRVGHAVEALRLHRGRITSARICTSRGSRYAAEADWFICAVPVERAVRLIDGAILRAAPDLEGMRRIETRWMNGVQFYLRRRVDINAGHVAYLDAPWALSSVSQSQFWSARDFARDYGDGEAHDCISAIASDWEQPGIVFGKPARACTREEIAIEVWAQIKAHLEDTGRSRLPDGIQHSWFLDPAIKSRRGRPTSLRNEEPLFVETPDLWQYRPAPTTGIPNLFLASDYVRNRSPIDAATMDGANAAARDAVNGLLAKADARADPVPVYAPYTAPEFHAAKQLDADRYRHGQPNLFDADITPAETRNLARR